MYYSFGALIPELPTKPPQGPEEAETGAIGQAAAKAACIASGGVWNEELQRCIMRIGPIIEAVENVQQEKLCKDSGGQWNSVEKTCKKPKKSTNLILWGILALGVGFVLVSNKSRRRS